VWRKIEEPRAQSLPEISTRSQISTGVISTTPQAAQSAPSLSSRPVACLSHGIRITGEITGTEDLFVDGAVQGSIRIPEGTVTVGPNGRVEGPIEAREIVVRGEVEGELTATERVHVWRTGQTTGDILAKRVVIEDGADIRGRVETLRERQVARAERAEAAQGEVHEIVALSRVMG
jgi:cytoskeletal protein CcmA (bactofilin family)